MKKEEQKLAKDVAEIYNKLNLLFHAILALPLLAFVWMYLEYNSGSMQPFLEDQSTADMLGFALPLMTVGVIVGAFILFNAGLRSIDPAKGLFNQVQGYFQKAIILYAMLELGLILNLVGYYLDQRNIYMAMYMIVLVFFSIYKPTLNRLAKHLNINGKDKDFLIDCRRISRGEEKEERNTHARL